MKKKRQQRASERLFITQPAISRPRHVVDDQLFYDRRVIYKTPTADALYLEVHRPLRGLEP
jgi:hypothetical protein